MRTRLLLGLALLGSAAAHAQVTTHYQEDFNSPPHAVVTYHTQSNAIPYWNDTAALAASAPMSYHSKVVANDTVFFTTLSFSTLGSKLVTLSFDQICKVHWGQRAVVHLSIDNGATWIPLGAAQYRGTSTSFPSVGYFNEVSYSNQSGTPYWGGPTTSAVAMPPTNSWWAHEEFDLSALAGGGPSGTQNGYANVMLRFALKYMANSGLSNPAGWFVDNIKVEGAPCETGPPAIRWNYTGASKPEGLRYVATHTVKLRAADPGALNSGIDTVKLHYRTNGGAWTSSLMTQTGSTACPDSAEYTGYLSTPNMGDSVDYWVEVKDCSCLQLQARSPAAPGTFYTVKRGVSPPVMCGASTPPSFPLVVTTFPFTEDFEGPGWFSGTGTGTAGGAHRGTFLVGNPPTGKNFEVDPAPGLSGFAWSLRNGPTPSATTGPDEDHTTGNGRYLYTEASQVSASQITTFTTPCIKLDNLNHPALEFYFHKYGANMGLLRVDIDTGAGFLATTGVIGAISIPGATHLSSTDRWNSAYVNLQPYLNKYVRVRFVGYKIGSPATDKGDMAIDDLTVYDAPAVDIKVLDPVLPTANKCSYSNQEVVKVRLANRGWSTSSSVQMGFSVKNLSTGVVTVRRDTLAVVWDANRMATIEFADKANLSAAATYEVRIWSEQPGDAILGNDTLPPLLLGHQTPITVPFFESYDGPSWVPSNGTPASAGTFGTTDWVSNPGPINPATGNPQYSFVVGSGLTPNKGTGPRWSRKRGGNYLYARSYISTGTVGITEAYLESRCINLVGVPNPFLSFWYHMNGDNCVSLSVQVRNEVTQQWTAIPLSAVTTPPQVQETDPWAYYQISLGAYAGTSVRLRIVATATLGSADADLAIDDLRVYNREQVDVGVEAITSPPNSVNIGPNQQNIQVLVRNFGSQQRTNVPLKVVVTNQCTPSLTSTYNGVIPFIAAGSTFTWPITATYSQGDMEIVAYTQNPGDTYAGNDTMIRRVSGQVRVGIPFGPVTFDNCSADEFGFWVAGGPGTLQIWELGTSSKGIGAASGTRAWHTGLSQRAYGLSNEYLYFPKFDGFDTLIGAELRFKHRFSFLNGDAGTLEYLNDSGDWSKLTSSIVNGYEAPYGSNSVPILASGPGWNGTTNNQYITSVFSLNFWHTKSLPLVIRAAFKVQYDGGSDWSIDDVEVVVPPQHSVSLREARPTKFIVSPTDSIGFELRVYNNARQPVSSIKVQVDNLGATPSYQTIAINPPLLPNQQVWVQLPTKYLVAPPGVYQPCFTVQLVNNRLDVLPAGDTACTSFSMQSPQSVTAANPYCADFEASVWPAESRSGGKSAWTRATPAHGSVQAAYNGTKAYATAPSGLYHATAREFLYMPSFLVDTSSTYLLSFYHNMQAEKGVDGGAVEYSYDGVNWFSLGSHQVPGSVNWYNEPSVVALDGLGGWSGSWNGYQRSEIRVKSANSGALRFRFQFGSSDFVHDYGWVVDQVCFEVAPTSGPKLRLAGQGPVYYSGCP